MRRKVLLQMVGNNMLKDIMGNHIYDFIRWIWRAPAPIYGSIIIIEAIVFCSYPTPSNHKIICGIILQVLGMLLALQVLWKLQNDFGASFGKPFTDWRLSFPLRTIDIKGDFSERSTLISVLRQPYSDWEDHQTGSHAERLDKISIVLEILNKENQYLRKKYDLLKEAHEEASKNTNISIEETKKEFRNQLKQAFTSDIQHSITGLVLLLVGVIISTIAGIS